jgi:NAD(P)-dependent dehydrogenase (short-subunit alcohol dehydrogenase family)
MVTGGAAGIGRAYCHALAEAGARVAVVDVDASAAAVVKAELQKKGAEAIAVPADVTNPQAMTEAVDRIVDRWGGLTIGVNNAGIGSWADAETSTGEQWRSVMNVNLDGVFYSCQAEARVMLAAGYGKIINTASMSARIVNVPQHQAAYNSSKAAVMHLTRSLAVEWATRGIRVNSISPGYTRTKLMDDLLETGEGETISKRWVDLTPTSRMLEVGDLQGAVVYLACEASDMVTGHDLVVDGGYTAV